MTELESLDLSHNMLSGHIPPQMKQMTFLSFFNVSYNNLTGPIPSGGQLDIYENSSYIGNFELCGPPLSRKCEPSEQPEAQAPEIIHKHSTFWNDDFNGDIRYWVVVVIGVGVGLAVGVTIENIVDLSEPMISLWSTRRRRRQTRRN